MNCPVVGKLAVEQGEVKEKATKNGRLHLRYGEPAVAGADEVMERMLVHA